MSLEAQPKKVTLSLPVPDSEKVSLPGAVGRKGGSEASSFKFPGYGDKRQSSVAPEASLEEPSPSRSRAKERKSLPAVRKRRPSGESDTSQESSSQAGPSVQNLKARRSLPGRMSCRDKLQLPRGSFLNSGFDPSKVFEALANTAASSDPASSKRCSRKEMAEEDTNTSEVLAILHKLDSRLSHLESLVISASSRGLCQDCTASPGGGDFASTGSTSSQPQPCTGSSGDCGRSSPTANHSDQILQEERAQSREASNTEAVRKCKSHSLTDEHVDKSSPAVSSSSEDSSVVEWTEHIMVRRRKPKKSGTIRRGSLFGRVSDFTADGNDDADSKDMEIGLVVEVSMWNRLCTLDPNSRARVLADALGFLCIVHDVIAIPWMLAWDLDLKTDIRYTLTATTIFWGFDIILSFFTGFYDADSGQLERRLGRVVKHYIKGWFTLDFAMISIDVLNLIMSTSEVIDSSTGMGLKIVRGMKMLKFAKMISLLRMAKLARIFQDVMDRYVQGGFRAAIQLAKLLCLVLWLSHITTCMWFILGSHNDPPDTQFVWFDSVQYLPDGHSFIDTGIWYQYSTSFHFALSQITANGVEMLSPLNSLERLFNIVCLIFGLFFSSHVVSTFSSFMMQLEMANQQKTQLLRQLTQFLSQYEVDHALSSRVIRQVKERMNSPNRIIEEAVPALQMLSTQLRRELHCAVVGDRVKSHPFFSLLGRFSDTVLPEMFDEAVKFITFQAGDVVFQIGNEADQAYIVDHGQISYERVDIMARVVDKGTWLAEAALWSLWRHVGEAVAISPCELITIKAELMFDILAKYETLGALVVEYGNVYHSHLQAAVPPAAQYPDDLQVAYTDYCDIVLSLSLNKLQMIGNFALRRLQKRGWRGGPRVSAEKIQKLQDELAQGKSIIIEDASGKVDRVTNIVAMRLQDAGGRIFAQLGKLSAGQWNMEVQLPGGKQRRAELPGQAINRILIDQVLQPLLPHIEIEKVDRAAYWKESAQYGIQTKYMRTTHHGKIHVPDTCDVQRVRSPWAVGTTMEAADSINNGNRPNESSNSLHGLDGDAFMLGNYLFMLLEPQDFAFLSSGKGKDLLDLYAQTYVGGEGRSSQASRRNTRRSWTGMVPQRR